MANAPSRQPITVRRVSYLWWTLLVAMHGLLASWAASALHGWAWWGWLLACSVSLIYHLRPDRQRAPALLLLPDGILNVDGTDYRHAAGSRIWPGVLYCHLRPLQPGPSRRLWLFADCVAADEYRALARSITLARGA